MSSQLTKNIFYEKRMNTQENCVLPSAATCPQLVSPLQRGPVSTSDRSISWKVGTHSLYFDCFVFVGFEAFYDLTSPVIIIAELWDNRPRGQWSSLAASSVPQGTAPTVAPFQGSPIASVGPAPRGRPVNRDSCHPEWDCLFGFPLVITSATATPARITWVISQSTGLDVRRRVNIGVGWTHLIWNCM